MTVKEALLKFGFDPDKEKHQYYHRTVFPSLDVEIEEGFEVLGYTEDIPHGTYYVYGSGECLQPHGGLYEPCYFKILFAQLISDIDYGIES